jgi:hypothetical protein
MNEEEFINSFDCNFPYKDRSAWMQIIEDGCKMSSNAAFAVLHEICRPPSGENVTSKELRDMADYWSEKADFPLKPKILPIAYHMIDQKEVPVSQALEAMDLVAEHVNEYGALAIAYFSCNDSEGLVEQRYREIISNWAIPNHGEE